jgi:acetyl-CoA carboxylase biotin carboxyl carrier protein
MDLRKVKKLLDLLEAHGLAEIEVESEGEKVRLRKNNPAHPGAAAPVAFVAPAQAVAPAAAAVPGSAAAEESKSAGTAKIVSPMVGTFYRAPGPEAEPFVSVGSHVDEDTVVCIIEAMKVMNAIKAETSGEIAAILVENGEAVEYGQPLFAVKTAAHQG